jgi:hypothetical protein
MMEFLGRYFNQICFLSSPQYKTKARNNYELLTPLGNDGGFLALKLKDSQIPKNYHTQSKVMP